MKSLFVKVFFWFWLAMTVVIVVFVIAFAGTLPKPPPHLPDVLTTQLLDTVGRASLAILPQGGPEQVRQFVDQTSAASRAQFFVFTESHVELATNAAPRRFHELLNDMRDDGGLHRVEIAGRVVFAKRVQIEDGNSAIAIMEVPRMPTLLELVAGPRVLVPIAAVLLVGGLLCYWLARSVAGPLRRMSRVATRLGKGNLTVRVGPELGRRHDELGTLATEFDAMAGRVESLLSAQQRLLRDVSHELRSPLTRLNLALELARQKSTSQAAAALDRIERESARLNKLIGQLLTLTRLDVESEQVRTEVDVVKLLQTIVEDAQFEAANRGVSVEFTRSQPCTVTAHLDTLYTALENVVRNAIRHTNEGTTVDIAIEQVDGPPRETRVCVRDSGPGIPEAELANVLRPFYSVESRSGGAGLGLAIADRVVRQLGGKITLANALTGGLIVQMQWPE